MTTETAYSEAITQVRKSVAALDIETPTATWYSVIDQYGDTWHHQVKDCAATRGTAVVQKSYPVTVTPPRRCIACGNQSRWDATGASASTRLTVILRDSLLHDGDYSVAHGLYHLGMARRAWSKSDQFAVHFESVLAQLKQDQAQDNEKARAAMPALADAYRDLVFLTQAQSRAMFERTAARELRYYCASALSAAEAGCVSITGADSPEFDDWNPLDTHAYDYDGYLADIAEEAFREYRDELRRDGPVTRAEELARRKLSDHHGIDPEWRDAYVASWTTELANVEAEQAAAGNVTLTLPITTDTNVWHSQREIFLRWVTDISADGTLTMTLPAVLADQVINAYQAALSYTGRDANSADLTPTLLDQEEQVKEIIRRFWTPGGADRLTAAIRNAQLICA